MDFGRDNRPLCRYGAGCYQKNPEHKARFKHPTQEKRKEEEAGKENIDSDSNAQADKRPLDEDSNEDFKRIRHDMSSTEDSSDAETDKDMTDRTADDDTSEDEVFDDLLPPSPENTRENLRQKFLMDMPEDFYNFYEFSLTLDKSNPVNAFSSVGLRLAGPFEVLAGTIPTTAPRSKQLYLAHHRFYFDPPELQTVLMETQYKTGFHLGYFRDVPTEPPVFVCSSVETEGPKLTPLGDNLFSGLYNFLAGQLDQVNPFTRTKMASMMEKVKLWVNKAVMEGNDKLNLERKSASMKNRDRGKVATTLHGAGLVVPYDKKTEVGYREIPESAASLKKILRNLVEAKVGPEQDRAMDVLQELVTNVQFANDEGDPGMGVELGLALLCQDQGKSKVLDNTTTHLLAVSYELLGRDVFTDIITAHLSRRTKGGNDCFAPWREK